MRIFDVARSLLQRFHGSPVEKVKFDLPQLDLEKYPELSTLKAIGAVDEQLRASQAGIELLKERGYVNKTDELLSGYRAMLSKQKDLNKVVEPKRFILLADTLSVIEQKKETSSIAPTLGMLYAWHSPNYVGSSTVSTE